MTTTGLLILGLVVALCLFVAVIIAVGAVLLWPRRRTGSGASRAPRWVDPWERDETYAILQDLRHRKAREKLLDELQEAHDWETTEEIETE